MAAFKLSLRLLLAVSWAALLVIVGLWLLWADPPGGIRDGLAVSRLMPAAGWMAIAAGQIVFTGLVADRLCPHADTRITGTLQALCLVVLVAGLGMFLWVWLGGASNPAPGLPVSGLAQGVTEGGGGSGRGGAP